MAVACPIHGDHLSIGSTFKANVVLLLVRFTENNRLAV
jgi:hypothetical protein